MLITILLILLTIIAFSQFDNKPLSEKRDICNMVKYIAALLVVNGHIFIFGFDHHPWAAEMNLGSQCVALFLFFSSYGLMFSYQSKGDDYLKGFILKRLGRILLPLLTAYALYIPIYYFTIGPIEPSVIIKRFFSADPFLRFSWYVSEIIILYLLFYTCFRLRTSLHNKALLLSLSTIIMMAIFYCLPNRGTYWIYSTPCFILGIYYQQYENQISDMVKSKQIILVALALLATLFFSRFDLVGRIIPVLTMWRFVFTAFFFVNIAIVIVVIAIVRNCKFVYVNALSNWGG